MLTRKCRTNTTVHAYSSSIFSGIQLQCPNEEQLSAFKAAVLRGDITWHAGPMNLQPEGMEPTLFQAAIRSGTDIDDAKKC